MDTNQPAPASFVIHGDEELSDECGNGMAVATAGPGAFKPAPAPLPEGVSTAIEAIPYPWAHTAVIAHLSDLTRRLAGAEVQLASREQELLDTLNRLVDERGTLRGKAEATEARVRELEAENHNLRVRAALNPS